MVSEQDQAGFGEGASQVTGKVILRIDLLNRIHEEIHVVVLAQDEGICIIFQTIKMYYRRIGGGGLEVTVGEMLRSDV
jgi:hypothetical protein